MKTKLTLLLFAGALAFASCTTKDCRCYEMTGSGWTGPHTTATIAGTPCADLNSPTRYCNEMSDPYIDPNDIAVGKK